jgi:hypothetical protein
VCRPRSRARTSASRVRGGCCDGLERYRDNDRAAVTLGPERYADGLDQRARSLEHALLALGAARDRADPDPLGTAEALEQRWSTMAGRILPRGSRRGIPISP